MTGQIKRGVGMTGGLSWRPAANNTSLDSGRGVFICERVVDHHTHFISSHSAQSFSGTATLPNPSCWAVWFRSFSSDVSGDWEKSFSSLQESGLEQVAQILHYLCVIVVVVVHAFNRQGPIVCICLEAAGYLRWEKDIARVTEAD